MSAVRSNRAWREMYEALEKENEALKKRLTAQIPRKFQTGMDLVRELSRMPNIGNLPIKVKSAQNWEFCRDIVKIYSSFEGPTPDEDCIVIEVSA